MDLVPVDIFLARQPIFDRDRRVQGYELLYRPGAENRFGDTDADAASAINLERALLTFGLHALIGERDAWINASRITIVRDHWQLLPAARTVVEVLESVEPAPDVIAACTRLRAAGYRLALDDFVERPDYRPLLELASVVKIDFRAHPPRERRRIARSLRQRGLVLVAEKIETPEEANEALGEGYGLLQGYFFCRPQMMRTKEMAPNRVGYLRLLHEVHTRPMDFPTIEGIIQQDIAMSLKLLRFLQSAAVGWTDGAGSIHQAMLLMGEDALRRWAALVAVFGLAQGKPPELVVVALTRARFAETLAGAAGLAGDASELFLAGLLSVVDALTDRPMVEALSSIAVSRAVREALLADAPPLGGVVRLVLAWERGDWDAAQAAIGRLGLGDADVSGTYAAAVLWAEDHAQP